MINDSENKTLSQVRKRRIERRKKIDGNMNKLLNKNETERKKNFDKTKSLEILFVKIKNAKNPHLLQSALKELN